MKEELQKFITENDIKFVRLAFCDILGTPKNISIMASQFEKATTEGISFDASCVESFADNEKSDLFLHPEMHTANILPWRPSQGRVVRFYCNITDSNKKPFAIDSREILKSAVQKAKQMGYVSMFGTESEFYLCKTDEQGNPTMIPQDEAGCYDIAPLDKGENVRRDICLTLEEMGLNPENSHHESGKGQNEIDFKYGEALETADNFMTFKSVVKNIAARNGLFASFMPKPFKDMSGSGLHINISLQKDGKNIFKDAQNGHSKEAESFIAGILRRIKEITLFLNPSINSYERLGLLDAPKYITWSKLNKGQLIRIPDAKEQDVRMELRSPDAMINPYISFALILTAGLEGIKENLPLCKSTDIDLIKADKSVLNKIDVLPQSLQEAFDIAKQSKFVKKVLGKEFFEKYLIFTEKEIKKYNNFADKDVYKFENYFKQM